MEEDVTKTVIKTLKAYLHEELPPDKDFFHELDSRLFLASATAHELVQLADQGKQDCVWKLVTYMEHFYTDEMLLKLCAFLEEYAQPARPRLATIASRIRQEISKHKPSVSLPVPEDPGHCSAGVHDVMAQCGDNPSRYAATKPTERDLKVVADRAGSNWSRLLTNLDIPWATIEKMRAESPTNLWEACMKGLVLWLKEGARDSNDPVIFGTLFAALKNSGMTDCVSLLVDRLDERSTPHSKPTHEDEDEELPTTLSEGRGKKKDTLLQEKEAQLREKDTLLQEKNAQLREKDTLIQEKDAQLREKDTQLQEKDENVVQLQLSKKKDALLQEIVIQVQEKDENVILHEMFLQLLEENVRLHQENSLLRRAHQKPSSAKKPASSSSPTKPFKPEQNKVFRSDLVKPGKLHSVKIPDLLIPTWIAIPVTIGRDVYLAGGVTGTANTAHLVQIYNMESGEYRTLPPSPQYYSAAVAIDGTLVLIGGRERDKVTNMVSTWMAAEERWAQDLPSMKMKRSGPGVLLLNNHLFVFGGKSENGETLLDSFETLDLNGTKQWSEGRGSLPQRLHTLQLGVFGDYVMLYGGINSAREATSTCYTVKVQALVDSVTNPLSPPISWIPIQDAPCIRSALLTNSQDAVLIGGHSRDGHVTRTIHRFSSSASGSRSWEVIGELSEPRSLPTVAAVSDRSFLVLGGLSDPKNPWDSQLKSVELFTARYFDINRHCYIT